MMKPNRGFTQFELIITMAVLLILLALVYPAYQHAIVKVRRAEARSALYSLMLQQERFYTQYQTYRAFNIGAFHADTKNTPFKWWSGDTAEKSYYELSATSCSSQPLTQCVLLVATPGTKNVKEFADPVCGNLMLDSTNNKSYSTGTKQNSLCW
jgi:type IV pilus assembly protein PilE